MLNLSQIEGNYPENLRAFKKNILREYLQYKILEIIFNSQFAVKLSFIGGTALRILYNNTRFSEDLDFDNFSLSRNEFGLLAEKVKEGLEKQGYGVEIRNVFKGAYRCYIKLPKILYDNKLSGLREEKIVIQIDTMPHHFRYKPERRILNKFDIFTQINVTPIDILLSQKIYAVLERKRAKGRDFFDVVFLLSKTKPNYKYLTGKLGIKNEEHLRRKLNNRVRSVDLKAVAKDVQAFLFDVADSKKILMFREYVEQAKL